MIRSEAYEQNPALSQSDLLLLERDVNNFYKTKVLGLPAEDKKSDALDLGSIIDAILLDPDALKGYYVMTDFKATGKVKDVVDYVVKALSTDPVVTYPEKLEYCQLLIEKAIEAHEYQTNWKLETRVNKIKSEGAAYYEQLLEAAGRTIVSLEIWEKAYSIVNQMEEDEFTGPVIKLLKNGSDSDHIVVHKSVELFGKHEDTELKGIVDFYIEDKREKTIKPWDLKTSKSLARFLANYRSSRYGRQGAFYTKLLESNYPDYKILPFSFLTIPTEGLEFPEEFIMDATELYANTEGMESPNGYHIKGWKELIRDYQWHKENAKWNHTREYYTNGRNILKGNLNVDPALLEVENKPVF